MSPGQYVPHFEWTPTNGLIRAALLGILRRPEMDPDALADLCMAVELIVADMDADSKAMFFARVIEPAQQGEAPAHFQIRRGRTGHYEMKLEP